MKTILVITTVYFLIGALLIAFVAANKHEKWLKYWVYLLLVSAMLTLYWCGLAFWVNIGILVIAYSEVWRLFRHAKKINPFLVALTVLSAQATALVYLSTTQTPLFMMGVYCLVFTFDGFSQLGGQLIGKHKLWKRISPNKTSEGLAVGTVSVVCTALFLFPQNTVWLVTFALWVSLCALFGDLAASWYKRQCGVKDYSATIPGHGGILDRFDGFLGASTGVVAWLLTIQ